MTESEHKVQEEGLVTGSPMTEYLKVFEFKAFQFKSNLKKKKI